MAKKKKAKKFGLESAPAAMPSPDDEWKVKDDYRTLTEAGLIRMDEKRLKAALAHGKKQSRAIKSIADLKKARDEMNMEDDD